MNSIEAKELRDPDLFSVDLHHCLLSQGLRSKRLRALLHLARGNGELERIFETKVNEFRRYLREARIPTIWNLPIRAGEWIADNARFTPPREVLTTLAYVAFVLVAFDAAKAWLPWERSTDRLIESKRLIAQGTNFDTGFDAYPPASSSSGEAFSKVDDWLTKELKRAADSCEWQQLLSERLKSTVASISADAEKVKVDVQRSMQTWFATEEFQQFVAEVSHKVVTALQSSNEVSESAGTRRQSEAKVLEAVVEKSLQQWFASEEFKQIVSDTVQKAIAVPRKLHDVSAYQKLDEATVTAGTETTAGDAR